MQSERIINRCRKYLLMGASLISLAFFAPDASEKWGVSFFKIAARSSWNNFLDLPAAWCSFKIILLSLGLFLVVECGGTLLAVAGKRRIAWATYLLHLLPGGLFLMGTYYFIKALL